MITVGAVLSLTGPFAEQGLQAARGLRLWVERVNALGGIAVCDRGEQAQLHLLIHDDQSRKREAIRWTEELLSEEHTDLLIGPYSSVLTLAVAPVAERHRKVLWNHGGASDELASKGFRFVVSVLSPASRYFVGMLDMLQHTDPGMRRVVLVSGARGTFPRQVIGGADTHALQHGFEVVLRSKYPLVDDDMASVVAGVADAHPDVILCAGRTEQDLLFAQSIIAQSPGARAIGLVAAGIQLFGRALGDKSDGFFGPSQWEPTADHVPDIGPRAAEFVARYRERFQAEPDYAAAQAYATGLVAQRCVEIAGTLRDEALREVASTLVLKTFYGSFRLDPASGVQTGHQVLIVQWHKGEKSIVWPT